MKFNLNREIAVSFDEDAIKEAAIIIADLKKKYADDETVFEGLLTALIFRQMEIKKPGTIQSIIASLHTSTK